MKILLRICLTLSLPLLMSCGKGNDQTTEPVLVSLLGKSYFQPDRPAAVQAKLDSNLAVAKANWEKDPSEENYIWYGRRLGYLLRLSESVKVFTEGIEKYPNSAKLYRHRGHRQISLRHFDAAVEDLSKARQLMAESPLELEPDGSPNKINIPLSTTQFNVLYHLALAHYLNGDFQKAEEAYQIRDSMIIVENDSYYKRCLMYQGKLPADSVLNVQPGDTDADLSLATQGYGVGNWYLYNGDSARAKAIFEKVVAGNYFAAFGFIAAEAELARGRE